jgi:uncharacterized protein (UPF0218 family)
MRLESADHGAFLTDKLFDVPKLLLTQPQRYLLKEPLGQLVAGSSSECNRALREVQETERPRRLVLVGDAVSRNAVQSGIRPDVIIIDHKEMRGEAVKFEYGSTRVFRTINEPGTIDLLAWQAVAEAIEKGDSVVLVEGEEDLLTLVAIMVAPTGSIVAYGQPGIGVVLVRVSANKKNEIQTLIDQMEKAD